ncbi:hypothetical protein KKH05_02705 [Patescibacteria group bacterium]|nr:hypothetical protein [Patescibacteria group bacterium]
MNRKDFNTGVSALPVVLIMSSIILEVLVAGLVISGLLSSNMANEQASLKALEIAKSGAHNAITRVIRYVDCPQSVYCPATSTLVIGDGEACINIEQTVNNREVTIYSRGTVQRREKYIKIVLGIFPARGTVDVQILKEVESPTNDNDETTSFTECSS